MLNEKIEITRTELEELIDERIQNNMHFSEDTIKYLSNLRERDLVDLRESIEFAKRIKTSAAVLKWAFLSIVTIVVGMVAFWEFLIKVKNLALK